MRANTQCTRGTGHKRGRRGQDKTVGNRDIMKSVEGRGMGRGTQGKQDGHYRGIQVILRHGDKRASQNLCTTKMATSLPVGLL